MLMKHTSISSRSIYNGKTEVKLSKQLKTHIKRTTNKTHAKQKTIKQRFKVISKLKKYEFNLVYFLSYLI